MVASVVSGLWLAVAAALTPAAAASQHVFNRVFQLSLLQAHDWEAIDFESFRDAKHFSSESIFFTCGQHSEHAGRQRMLSEQFGVKNVRIAAVDHVDGNACFVVYGHEEKMDELAE
jgi:hypothetical protein